MERLLLPRFFHLSTIELLWEVAALLCADAATPPSNISTLEVSFFEPPGFSIPASGLFAWAAAALKWSLATGLRCAAGV